MNIDSGKEMVICLVLIQVDVTLQRGLQNIYQNEISCTQGHWVQLFGTCHASDRDCIEAMMQMSFLCMNLLIFLAFFHLRIKCLNIKDGMEKPSNQISFQPAFTDCITLQVMWLCFQQSCDIFGKFYIAWLRHKHDALPNIYLEALGFSQVQIR